MGTVLKWTKIRTWSWRKFTSTSRKSSASRRKVYIYTSTSSSFSSNTSSGGFSRGGGEGDGGRKGAGGPDRAAPAQGVRMPRAYEPVRVGRCRRHSLGIASACCIAPPLETVLQFTRSLRVVTWLGACGASSPKPLQLWSTDAAATQLKRKKPANVSLCSLVVRQNRKFTGKKNALKTSAAYPRQFGHAVALLTNHRNGTPGLGLLDSD